MGKWEGKRHGRADLQRALREEVALAEAVTRGLAVGLELLLPARVRLEHREVVGLVHLHRLEPKGGGGMSVDSR